MGFYLNKLILYTVNFTKPLLTMDENDIKACGDNKCDSKLLRSNLAPWKEFVVLASKLSKWEQPFYPVIIFALVSIKFLFVFAICVCPGLCHTIHFTNGFPTSWLEFFKRK